MEAIDRGSMPVKRFLLRYAREKDLALFTAAGQVARPNTPEELPMRVVVPAYILSELKAGFSIGAVLFLPFLLIDIGDGLGDHLDWHVSSCRRWCVSTPSLKILRLCHGGWLEPAGWIFA